MTDSHTPSSTLDKSAATRAHAAAPAPESSDAYAADSLAADTAALNLLSVGYGDADRRRYAPRQQGYGGY